LRPTPGIGFPASRASIDAGDRGSRVDQFQPRGRNRGETAISPKSRAPAAHAVLARFDEEITHTERRVLQEGKR
jgi:hypothetical protein